MAISEQQALEIATAAAAAAGWDVRDAHTSRWSQCSRPPGMYLADAAVPSDAARTDHWVVYFPNQLSGVPRIRNSQVAIVHCASGQVLHLGGASDEG